MNIKNILITGLGGQGINALYQVLQSTIIHAGLFCKGAIFKGGAQKRGAVYAMIRIFEDKSVGQYLSPIIPNGDLDLLVAFEVNEALRYHRFFHKNTKMIINDFAFPFYNERFKNTKKENPLEKIKTHFDSITVIDFNKKSQEAFGHPKMANVLMGFEVIKTKEIPIDVVDFLDNFQKKVSIKYEDMLVLMEIMNVE